MAQSPSLKAKKLIRALEAQPLGYRVVRQKGSRRKLEAPNHPPITLPSTTTDVRFALERDDLTVEHYAPAAFESR